MHYCSVVEMLAITDHCVVEMLAITYHYVEEILAITDHINVIMLAITSLCIWWERSQLQITVLLQITVW